MNFSRALQKRGARTSAIVTTASRLARPKGPPLICKPVPVLK